jgi:hypothetical protein
MSKMAGMAVSRKRRLATPDFGAFDDDNSSHADEDLGWEHIREAKAKTRFVFLED